MDDERGISSARISATKDWSSTEHEIYLPGDKLTNMLSRRSYLSELYISENQLIEKILSVFKLRMAQELIMVGDRPYLIRWNDLNDQLADIASLENRLTEEDNTITYSRIYLLRYMTDLQYQLHARKLRSIFRKHDLENKFMKELALYEFTHCRFFVPEVEGLELNNILLANPNKIDLGSAFYFLQVAGRKLDEDLPIDELVDQLCPFVSVRYRDFGEIYPATFIKNFTAMYNFVSGVINSHYIGRGLFVNKDNSKIANDIASRSLPIMERFEKIFSKINAAFLDKSDKAHLDILDKYSDILDAGYHRGFAVHLLGANLESRSVLMYRISKKYEEEGYKPEIFGPTKMIILDKLANNPVHQDWLEVDDLDMLFDLNNEPQVNIDNKVFSVRRSIQKLFSITSNREYSVDPDLIQWQKMVTPRFVSVTFNPQHSLIADISFKFASQEGEELRFKFSLDLRREDKFDWNCLEDPHHADPIIIHARAICLDNVNRILEYLISEASVKKSQKHTPILSERTSASKREKGNSEIYLLRKEKSDYSNDQTEELVLNVKEDIQLRHEIEIDYQLLEKDLRQLSDVDFEAVKKDIEDYNNRGVGKFKSLRSRGREGQKLYSFRVDCTTRAGIRVLLEDVPSSKAATRIFRAISVGYRKDIYRQNKI